MNEQEFTPRPAHARPADRSLAAYKEFVLTILAAPALIAPIIEIARKARMPLKIAGETQPEYRDYFEQKVKPEIRWCYVQCFGIVSLARTSSAKLTR